ncbi:hypothetical protein [Cohnella candidum]|uniref:Pilus assembly protein n=1 Tax=Cohnella candidum TaxID=2674991 RepID=A0A3G3JZK8_9BACL|nr:hypothetical protein [Cohnella candidum]AYQ73678.1 hypothetical protein EAV92_14465 [Cohnella candidum]
MRRLTRRITLINNRGAAREEGSVALETALVMPVFLMLVFLLLFLVQTAIVAIAMQGALTQTVRLAASSWYPITLSQQEKVETAPSEKGEAGNAQGDIRETVGELAEWLPSPLGDWAEALADGRRFLNEEAAKAVLEPLALKLSDARVLAPERFRVTSVDLPEEDGVSAAFLTVQAEYRLPFRVPFSGMPLTIRASARERVWSGGSPSRARAQDTETSELDIAFVSLEPNPVRPGRKATLVLRTQPGTSLDLSVLYKSGNSQAKHLGQAVADGSGRISWTWHVSGNTTSGEWNWTVRGEGGASFSMPFRVERK